MSCTEIYAFGKDGNAYLYGEVRNSWRGGMAIWRTLEEKYLPFYIPDFVKGCNWYRDGMDERQITQKLGYKPDRCIPSFGDGNPMQEIWDLFEKDSVSMTDKIVLYTTFDKTVVMKAEIRYVIDAFTQFGGETSLKEQAEILVKMLDDENVIAVGWNQTSCNGDGWANYNFDEEEQESFPYNILTQTDHETLGECLTLGVQAAWNYACGVTF